MTDNQKKALLGFIGLLLFILILVAVNGCATEAVAEPPFGTTDAHIFTYTHTGCPVDLLVWVWPSGTLIFSEIDLDSSITIPISEDFITWRLRVDNGEPLGFTVDGYGDCTLTQPGCF